MNAPRNSQAVLSRLDRVAMSKTVERAKTRQRVAERRWTVFLVACIVAGVIGLLLGEPVPGIG